jgi:Tse3 toxin immunity protein Tsi3
MPHWMALIAVVAVIGAFGGATAQAQEPADPTNLKTFGFMLGDVQYRILLPKHATLTRASGSDRFHVSLSMRMVRQMELLPAPSESGKAYPRTQALSNGAVLKFGVRDPEGDTGSGGPEQVLEGHLQIGERTLAVRCHDQGEWPSLPGATWCIAYLHHLAVAAGR